MSFGKTEVSNLLLAATTD